jgi:hypothetical protein
MFIFLCIVQHHPVALSVISLFCIVQLYYVGQAFRLGRYPIHFHMNGNMSKSYARGVSIQRSFNRAVNIHGTHNLMVEHCVSTLNPEQEHCVSTLNTEQEHCVSTSV